MSQIHLVLRRSKYCAMSRERLKQSMVGMVKEDGKLKLKNSPSAKVQKLAFQPPYSIRHIVEHSREGTSDILAVSVS